ncbi:putative tRNA (Uracil-O(2)-)-methyltransferase [Fasciola hepatica]|uniref:tRNA (Uracil-O(2)-)-methyltransferase n=1 Tax=Fasciola hepatica TaxID=6192 RepID=A0A4E0RT89_FASHE|nr:putative tRNA (Uracil-O(2)-)-methyltransferase [Fasciola hepatica]
MRTFCFFQICIIGRKRCTSAEDQSKQLGNIHEAIERERQVSAGMDRFIPRDFKIPVQNCTQIETTVKQRVSDLVFRILLTKPPELHWLKTQNLVISDSLTVQTTDGRWWNPGGQLTVQEASALLEADQLKLMKSQHGGLQTLLKNHHQAFEIRSGLIRLRFDPERMAQLNPSGGSFVSRKPAKKRLIQRKTKPCWMFSHHVDGCPYPSETCDFLHKTENISLISAE